MSVFVNTFFSCNKSEQIVQSTPHSSNQSDISLLPNLLNSPLFHTSIDYTAHSCAPSPHTPIFAHPHQPYTSPCPSPYTCLSNNHVACTGIDSAPSALQRIKSVVVGSPSYLTIASPLFVSNASSASSASTINSASTSTDRLNLVVNLSSYLLQQDSHLHLSLPTLLPMVNRHHMAIHPRQPKIANLTAFSATTTTPATRVMSSLNTEPTAFSDTDIYEVWHGAIRDEIQVFHSNNTWSLVPFYPSMNIVGNRWVYMIKHRVDSIVERYKAHLVTRGFTQ